MHILEGYLFLGFSFSSSSSLKMASTSLRISITIQCPRKKSFFVGHTRSTTNLILPRQSSPSSTVLTFSRRRHSSSSSPISSKKHKNKKKQVLPHKNDEEDDDLDEDAFEALFRQLEEDLKNDDLSLNDGDEDDISEEDLKKLEEELDEALKDDELLAALGTIMGDQVEDEEEEEEEEQEEEEELKDADEGGESPLQLKNWQLRRLAHALKKGRRKISIKNLAADLCLDRAVVLELLREPPPNLLMMSAALPDEPVSPILEPATTAMGTVPLETASDDTEPEVKEKVPVHVMQSNWSAQKRLKKVQLETLERVYGRTKRPTNAMIGSIVHVTNLPRKRVVRWFEDKRVEDGVPERRRPYQPAASETANTR